VIFDLDGTLLDNRPRTVYIFRELASVLGDDLPQLQRAMEAFVPLDAVEYSLEATLRAIGVDDPAEIETIIAEWGKRFFSDTYQRFDIPHPGGRKFVDAVHRAGATVIYLTGRDRARMLVGTTESLRQYGFPVGIVGTMTIVKADIAMDDETFKLETVDYLKRLGTVVATFENEPANANMLLKAFPYTRSYLLTTQHSPGAPEPVPEVIAIRDFKW